MNFEQENSKIVEEELKEMENDQYEITFDSWTRKQKRWSSHTHINDVLSKVNDMFQNEDIDSSWQD